MAYDEGLAERIRDVIRDRKGITEKKMFGGLAFLLTGHMFIGISGDKLMARVGAEAYDAALQMPNVRVMDFTGKPMKGYVYVDSAGYESDESLEYWVNSCAQFAGTLPPK
jgi:TfoX/Sxy family transcriptional regulator of competence genes